MIEVRQIYESEQETLKQMNLGRWNYLCGPFDPKPEYYQVINSAGPEKARLLLMGSVSFAIFQEEMDAVQFRLMIQEDSNE